MPLRQNFEFIENAQDKTGMPFTEYAMIDSTIVRAHQHSAGAKGGTGKRNASGAQKAS